MSEQKFFIRVIGKGISKTASGIGKVAGSIKRMTTLSLGSKIAIGAMGVAGKKMLDDFGRFEEVERGFENLTKAAGMSSATFGKLKEATNGTMNATDLMTQANNAMILGVVENENQMAELFDTAQRLAAVMGKDATFGIESMVTGMGRQSKLMLDNLGIMVDVQSANEEYAKELNKTTSELTESEKKTAFNNATLKASKKILADIGEEVPTTRMSMQMMTASIKDMAVVGGEQLAPMFNTLAVNFRDFSTSLMETVGQTDFLATFKNMLNNMPIVIDGIAQIVVAGFDYMADYVPWALGKGLKIAWGTLKGFAIELKDYGFIIGEYLSAGFLIALEKMKIAMKGWTGFSTAENEAMLIQLETKLANTKLGKALTDDEDIKDLQGFTDKSLQILEDTFGKIQIKKDEQEKDGSPFFTKKTFKDSVDDIEEVEMAIGGIEQSLVDAGQAGAGSLATSLQTLAGEFEGLEVAAKRAAQVQALVDAYASANAAYKAMAGIPVVGPVLGGVAAGLALTAGLANVAQIEKAEEGYSGMVTKPTMFLAGEAGAENVQITNLDRVGGGMRSGNERPIHVSITGNVMTKEFVEKDLIFKIKDAVRKGIGFGRTIPGAGNIIG